MTTRQHILRLLRGHEASRIRFTFPLHGTNFTINRTTFESVARAIVANTIHVTVTRQFPPGVGAQYDGTTNTILTPPVFGRWDEATVMHESTHAAFDLMRTPVSGMDEEAAAYVVGALYSRMTGLNSTRWSPNTQAARGVVERILHHYAVGNPGIPAVDAAAWLSIRAVVALHPIYFSGPAGLPAQIIPGINNQYTHDG
jgi:hypothetical protein